MAIIQSAQSGFYDQGSTWVGGVVPAHADAKHILAGHTVVVRNAGGTVSISCPGSQSLWIQAGATLRVINGGWICQDSGCEVDIDGVLELEGSGGIQWATTNTFEGSSGTGRVCLRGRRSRTYRGKNGMQHLAKFASRTVL